MTSATHLWRAARDFDAAVLSVVPASASLWAPCEQGIGTNRDVSDLAGLHCAAIYEIVAARCSAMFMAPHLRAAVG